MIFVGVLSLALVLATTLEASPTLLNYEGNSPSAKKIANAMKEFTGSVGPGAKALAAEIFDLFEQKCTNNGGGGGSSPGEGGGAGGKITNIALGKVAVQTSVCCGNAIASRAVDGSTDGAYGHASVTHTKTEDRPYWRVDLGRSCVVQKVVIFNRVDCCGERLQNFDVSLEDFAFQPIKTYFHGLARQAKFEFGGDALISGVEHVRVQLRGKNYLSLAEVQVFGHCSVQRTGFDNVALNKYAFQSSTYTHALKPVAAKAVDGNIDGKFNVGSTTHTKNDNGAWWEVDLGHTAEIATVLVFNRVDCCGGRLANFKVILYNFAHQTVDTLHQAGGGELEYGFVVAPPKNARFIRVQLLGRNYLQLAEVEVFGKLIGGYENIAVGKAASQSSTYSHAANPIADKAVDGLVDGHFNVRSTTHTNRNARAWWEVDLGANENVYGVTVYNRLDCCRERLQNFDVFLTDASGKVTKTTHFGVGVFVTYPVHIPNGVIARKVKVQLRGTNYLQLAEVQVWAGSRTCGGTGNGARCAFPFTHKGVEYSACTSVGGNRPWCATKPGDLSTHNEWGFCFCS